MIKSQGHYFIGKLMQISARFEDTKNKLWAHYPVKQDYAIVFAILLFATWLRFNGLNEPGLWYDEAAYTITAQKPIIDQIINPIETLRIKFGNADPVLSSIPFSLSLMLGFSNFLARFPAALFGILSVAVIYRFGRTLFGNTSGLIAALLLCTSSFHILYSQEARSYSQLVLFSLLSFYFFYQAITHNKLTYWLLYTLFTWAGISSHYVMAFAIFIQGITLLLIFLQLIFLRRAKIEVIRTSLKIWIPFCLSQLAIFLSRMLWLNDLIYWSDKTVGGPYTLDIIGSFTQLIPKFTGDNFLAILILLVVYLFGLVSALYHFPERGLLLASWLIFAIPITAIGLWFISQFFHERYVIWGLPALLLTATYGVMGIGRLCQKLLSKRKLTFLSNQTGYIHLLAISLLVIPVIVINLRQVQHNSNDKQKWLFGQLQEASYYIAAEAKKGEGVIAVPNNAQYLKLYIDQIRQDLIFFDSGSNVLPKKFEGRWHVFYSVSNVPQRWQEQVNYKKFNDILVVYRPGTCKLEDCINDTRVLFLEIAQANPNSTLEDTVNLMLSGLTKLPVN